MKNEVYYGKEELANRFEVSERIISEITVEFVKVITIFGKKKGISRQYTYDEANAIEHVINQKGRIKRKAAVVEALRSVFHIESER